MRYRFEPAIFASAPRDKRDRRWHLTSAFSQRLRKYTFTAVHTKTCRRRFQIYPLWRAFSNLCVYGERFHRLRVDGRHKRIKKYVFTSVCVYNLLRVDGAWGVTTTVTRTSQICMFNDTKYFCTLCACVFHFYVLCFIHFAILHVLSLTFWKSVL